MNPRVSLPRLMVLMLVAACGPNDSAPMPDKPATPTVPALETSMAKAVKEMTKTKKKDRVQSGNCVAEDAATLDFSVNLQNPSVALTGTRPDPLQHPLNTEFHMQELEWQGTRELVLNFLPATRGVQLTTDHPHEFDRETGGVTIRLAPPRERPSAHEIRIKENQPKPTGGRVPPVIKVVIKDNCPGVVITGEE